MIWDKASSLEYMNLTNETTLARKQALSIFLSPPPQNVMTGVHHSDKNLYVGSGVWTQVPLIAI